jgi:hypothetical protein
MPILVSELSSASALQDEALNGMTVKLRQMGFVWRSTISGLLMRH